MENRVKTELQRCFTIVWGLSAIIASAGAMNTGKGFYFVFGIINIILNGFAIYKYTKQIQEHEEK